MQKVTAYMTVYLSIKKLIKEGAYKPGTLLPTERDLEKIYAVSRITVRRAIAMLSDEGYVKVVQGKGTEVRDISTTQQLNTVTSITETLKRKGYNITVEGVNIQLVQPPEIVREKLKLEPEVTVYLIQRILYADDKPIALMNNYLVKDQIPGFEQYAGKFVGLYNFLENTYGVVVTEADDTFSAVNADYLEAQVLHLKQGAALLRSRRIGYTEKGPFEYVDNKLVGDRYEFSIHMTGRIR